MSVTIVIEDGAGRADANSYASVGTADAYFGARPRSNAWKGLTAEAKARLLIHATRLLDASFAWDGRRLSSAQALEFPRFFAELAAPALPAAVLHATCELALLLNAGDLTADSSNASYSRIEVGPIKLEMSPQAAQPAQIPAFIRNLVAAYGSLRGTGLNAKLIRT